jgi:HD-GYP domain-containing protein (c-di-GMP phosphodiesterase class II)
MDRRVMSLAALVAVAASLIVIFYLTLVSHEPVFWFSVVLLGLLMVLYESLGDRMAGGSRSTYGIIILFAAIASLNTASAMIVALFGAAHLGLLGENEEVSNLLLNAGFYALYTWGAAALYHVLGGGARSFTLASAARSLAPLALAALAFWAMNSLAVGGVLAWSQKMEPKEFFRSDALRLLPNQLIYAFVGLGLGIIYAQSAFHVDPSGLVVGSVAESLRGLFAVASFSALVGVAWYFSGKNIELLEAYDRSVETLMTYMEKREPYLDGHAVRVADHAAHIAKQMRLPLYEIDRLRHAALLHDLGRPAIPLGILLERGSLSEDEFERIKVHPLEGAARLEEVEYLGDMAEAVRHHHEYYDGGGYIDHLSGDTIPLSARIIAVADAYDAMMHERPWRAAKGHELAVQELRANSGRQFDPDVVEHFFSSMSAAQPARETIEPGMKPEAKAVLQPRERPAKKKGSRRERLLQERREARERLEREAFMTLGEQPPPDFGEASAGASTAVPEPEEFQDNGGGAE